MASILVDLSVSAAARWPAGWRGFWFEPWRWADSGWFAAAGVPHALYAAGSPAMQRVLMAGWCSCFALNSELTPATGTYLESYPPASAVADLAHWLDLCAGEPAQLRQAARLVGWALYLELDSRCGAALADPARRQALHYLQARPLRIELTLGGSIPASRSATKPGSRAGAPADVDTWDVVGLGLRALERLAAVYAPSMHSRVAMMLPPDSTVPGLILPETPAAAAEQPAALLRLARLWHAAQRWAIRLSAGSEVETVELGAA